MKLFLNIVTFTFLGLIGLLIGVLIGFSMGYGIPITLTRPYLKISSDYVKAFDVISSNEIEIILTSDKDFTILCNPALNAMAKSSVQTDALYGYRISANSVKNLDCEIFQSNVIFSIRSDSSKIRLYLSPANYLMNNWLYLCAVILIFVCTRLYYSSTIKRYEPIHPNVHE